MFFKEREMHHNRNFTTNSLRGGRPCVPSCVQVETAINEKITLKNMNSYRDKLAIFRPKINKNRRFAFIFVLKLSEMNGNHLFYSIASPCVYAFLTYSPLKFIEGAANVQRKIYRLS